MKEEIHYPIDSCMHVHGDKNDLVNHLKSLVTTTSNDSVTSKNYTLLHLTIQSCGCVKSWKDYKDLPGRSVKCEHGNYFIYYKKKRA